MSYLPPTRELRERLDTAQTLTRLFYREQAVVLACGGLDPAVRAVWSTRPSWRGRPGRARWRRTRCGSASSSSATRRVSSTSRPRSSPSRRPTTSAAGRPAARRLRAPTSTSPTTLADGPSIRIVEAALARQGASGRGARGPIDARPRDAGRDDRYFDSSFYWPDVLDPTLSVRRGRRAPAALGGQPPERGLGGRHRRPDPPRALAGARLGVHARRRALALRRDAATC